MAPARNQTRDHAVYDRRSRPRDPSAPAPTTDTARKGFAWGRAAMIVVAAAIVAGLFFAARSLAHWPDAFF